MPPPPRSASLLPVTGKPPSSWPADKAAAKGILRDRSLRRRAMGRCLVLLLAMFAIGLWVIEGWLEQNIWRFFLWWAGCGAVAVLMVIFALYDAMAVIREEREKM